MDKAIEQAAISAVDQVKEYLVRGADFAISQAPDVAREAVTWGRFESVFMINLSIMLVCLCVYCCKSAVKYDQDDSDIGVVASVAVAVVAAIVSIPMFVGGTASIKAWICPKLYLVEVFLK